MKRTVPGIEIPEGESCSFPDGRWCALFDWGLNGPAFCAGWGGLDLVRFGDGLKHPKCLALCGIVDKKSTLQNEEKFRNPADPWSREGKFSVELDQNLPPRLIPYNPSWVTVEKEKDGIVVSFKIEGKIQSSDGLIRIHIGVDHFVWRRGSIKTIRNEDGSLLYKKGASRLPKLAASAAP